MRWASAGGALDTKNSVDLFTDTRVNITDFLAAVRSYCVLRGAGGRLFVLLLLQVQRACGVLCCTVQTQTDEAFDPLQSEKSIGRETLVSMQHKYPDAKGQNNSVFFGPAARI